MINDNTDYSSQIDLSNKNNPHTKILNLLKPNSRILEFGPAKGHMTKHLSKELNCKVTCVELNPDFLPYLQPYAEKVILSNIDNLDWEKEFQKDPGFDAIIFADVLEHLYDPWIAINHCQNLLLENGSLFASIPNVGYSGLVASLLLGNYNYRPLGLLDKTHIRFFTRNSMIDLFEKNGYYIHFIDKVFIPWNQSEFSEELANVSPAFREIIRQGQDSDVYQFIFEAKKMGNKNSILLTSLEHQLKELKKENNFLKEENNILKTSKSLAVGKFILWPFKLVMRKK